MENTVENKVRKEIIKELHLGEHFAYKLPEPVTITLTDNMSSLHIFAQIVAETLGWEKVED